MFSSACAVNFISYRYWMKRSGRLSLMLSSACAVNFISYQLPVLDEKEWEAELDVL